ncbi:protein SCO1/2 [Paraburkholderia atlantica]|uniref:SCO family protein n=1 Tax=Paraburkholderia TaxID=1822464 RepID=UPI0034CD81BA
MSETMKRRPSQSAPSLRRRRLLGAALLLALAACGKRISSKLHVVDLSSMKLPGTFHLRDTNGNPRTLEDFRGNVVLLLFGYTRCPDVCPATLARAAQTKRLLGDQGNRLKVIFITVDPERDTPAILEAYTAAFDPTFIGLYGDAQQTAEATRSFGAYRRRVSSGNSYTMEHSALDYIIDTTGVVRFALQYEESAEDIAKDLKLLL